MAVNVRPIRDPEWRLQIKRHWVIAFRSRRDLRFGKCEGNFFEAVSAAPPDIEAVYVFRSDGLFCRAYERVYRYFRRIDDFSILELEPFERAALWKNLGYPLRQYGDAA